MKEKIGKTGSQWITDKTLASAKILMESFPPSLKEISYLLGFTYTSYSSIFFKKHTGQTPSNY
ncbi:AraC family transcriptional regulator [Arenibacter sp. F20364]|nr:AraC family transcriptional regulator [Arenibacter sp. F20364]